MRYGLIMEIGERIGQARDAASLSKSELARRIGVHPSACIQWEALGGTKPTVEHLVRIAILLDVRFEWLATGRGDMSYDPGVREESPSYTAGSADEGRLLAVYRRLSAKKKKSLLTFLSALADEDGG